MRRGLPSSRVCPLCRSAVGTPRQVIMSCAAVSSSADAVWDAVEAELARHSLAVSLCVQAEAWWQRECEHGRGGLRAPCCPGADVRWPILHAWRSLLPMPVREAAIGSDVGGHSAHGTGLEGAVDLAYCCAMPRALGLALCRGPGPPLAAEGSGSDSDGGEGFATLAEPGAAAAEASRRSAALARYRPAVEVTTVLALGVRSLRGAYAELVGRWRQLAAKEELSLQRFPVVEVPVGLPPAPPVRAPVHPRFLVLRSLLAPWAATPSGSRSVSLLRWQVPTEAALVARIRRELPPSGASDGQILSEVEPLGIPVRGPDGPRWGHGFASWDAACASLSSPCSCPGAAARLEAQCCLVCGGVVLPAPLGPGELRPCRWCGGDAEVACPGCFRGVHFLGRCRTWLAGAHELFALAPSRRRGSGRTAPGPGCSGSAQRVPPAPAAGSTALSDHLASAARACLWRWRWACRPCGLRPPRAALPTPLAASLPGGGPGGWLVPVRGS